MVSLALDAHGVPAPGEVLAGKYRILRTLGKGGIGVVVEAWHTILEQKVAIKFLLPTAEAQQPEARHRFLREAKATASLQNEHVVRVLDVGGLPSGADYIVLELLVGVNFEVFLQERRALPVGEAVDYLLQAGEAIAEAHARGIFHRDLKPQNLFLTQRADGIPLLKVLDFGLSKVLAQGGGGADDANRTATDTIIGTVRYMSPEQIRGLKHADARTDIWALGVILYQMLAGHRPFESEENLAVIAVILSDAHPPLSSYRPDVPRALEHLIDRCLEKDVSKRVQNMGELALGLAPFASPEGRRSMEIISRLLPKETAELSGRTSTPSSTFVIAARAATVDSDARPGLPLIEAASTDLIMTPSTSSLGAGRTFPVSRFAITILTVALSVLGTVVIGVTLHFKAPVHAGASGVEASSIPSNPNAGPNAGPKASTTPQLDAPPATTVQGPPPEQPEHLPIPSAQGDRVATRAEVQAKAQGAASSASPKTPKPIGSAAPAITPEASRRTPTPPVSPVPTSPTKKHSNLGERWD